MESYSYKPWNADTVPEYVILDPAGGMIGIQTDSREEAEDVMVALTLLKHLRKELAWIHQHKDRIDQADQLAMIGQKVRDILYSE